MGTPPTSALDSVATQVLANRILGIAEEMSATLIRASFSPNIKERADCSTAVFDSEGRVIAQAQRIPIHLGSMLGVIHRIQGRPMRAGDMFLANDPYVADGQHLPDLNLVAPLILDGQVTAFVASIAHHSDVGGMLPGSESAACRSIYQEGIRIPPVRLVREGDLEEDLVETILLNSRAPTDRLGDLKAQVAANRVGIDRLTVTCREQGMEKVAAAMQGFLAYTERRFRQAVHERMQEGTFQADDWLDEDGPGSPPVPIRLRLEVHAGHLSFDFAGTGPQLGAGRNVPFSGLAATIYTVCKSLIDPGLPPNSGYYDAISIQAPRGSLVNPLPPAAVGARSLTCGVLGDVIAGALSGAMPENAVGCSGPHAQLVLSGTDETGGYFVDYETYAGGTGARPTHDGLDSVRIHASGASNLPVEALELAFPLRVERYQLREDSGGPGQFRGGMGVRRDYVMLRDAEVSLSGERQVIPAHGVQGGCRGLGGEFRINGQRVPGTVAARQLRAGDVLTLLTPGGGGFGRPEDREVRALLQDLEQEKVSMDRSGSDYRRPDLTHTQFGQKGVREPIEQRWSADWARAEFAGCRDQIYVDVASRGLLPNRARAALDAHLEDAQLHGATKNWWFEIVERARERLGGLLRARASEIAFTKNTSEGLNIVAHGLDWRAGDNVVIGGESEHPNNIYTWLNLHSQGVDVRVVPTRTGRVDVEDLAGAMDSGTRVCAVSWVNFQPGARTDLARLSKHCRKRDVLLMVDGAQAVGVLDADVIRDGIDAMAAPTSKGLLGLYGMGFLYCSEEWCERLRPTYLSRYSVDLGDQPEEVMGARNFKMAEGARRFEIGNFNYAGAFALDASLSLLQEVGTSAIQEHVLSLSRKLVSGLQERRFPVEVTDESDLSHIVCVGQWEPGQYSAAPWVRRLADRLEAERVRASVRRGTLRFSLHLWNTMSEVDRILEILDLDSTS